MVGEGLGNGTWNVSAMIGPQRLLNSQANELFRAITKAGLDPADFEWRTASMSDSPFPDRGTYYTVDVLVYRSAETTFFRFGRDRVMYSPGYAQRREQGTPRDWTQTVRHFDAWLNNIKREAEPNLWKMIAESTTLSAGALDVPPTHFTQDEQAEILARLDAMAKQIEALDSLTQEQKRLINAELQNIGVSMRRMDRGEWLRFALGSMLAVVLSSGLQNTVAASLMRWTAAAFHSVVTGTPMPPLLLPP